MQARLMQQNERRSRERAGNVWQGLAAGVAGGLVASVVMNQYQALWSKLTHGEERSHGAQSLQQGLPQQGVGRELQKQGKDEAEDDAPERLANAISAGIFDHELTERAKDVGGTVLHYAMGVTSGALYGAMAEVIPEVKAEAQGFRLARSSGSA